MKNLMKSVYLKPAILCLLLTISSFVVHILPSSNSMLNTKYDNFTKQNGIISNNYLSNVVYVHKVEPAFARRPVTTFLIEQLAIILNTKIGVAFIVLNYFFFFLCGLLIFKSSMLIGNNYNQSLLGIICFYLSFTVIFAFFPSNYTYDEPLQYFLILLSINCLLQNKWGGYILFFSLSLIVRESSIILLPAFLLFWLKNNKILHINFSKLMFLHIVRLTIPVIIYLLFLLIFISFFNITDQSYVDLKGRFYFFHYNFQNSEFASETFFSMFLAFGLSLYFLLWFIRDNITNTENKLFRSFILSIILNSTIIILFAKAREIRLFALPLLFAWPMMGKVVNIEFLIIKDAVKSFTFWLSILWFLFCGFISILISKYLYTPTEPNPSFNFFHEYLSIALVLLIFHFMVRYNYILKHNRRNY